MHACTCTHTQEIKFYCGKKKLTKPVSLKEDTETPWSTVAWVSGQRMVYIPFKGPLSLSLIYIGMRSTSLGKGIQERDYVGPGQPGFWCLFTRVA